MELEIAMTTATAAALPNERSLLIVEDDKSFLQRLARAMEGRGFVVTTAESVAEGLLQVEKAAPAFAVVDMRLGDGNGLDVISAMKKRRPEARAIILTGYGNIATAVNAVKLGAVDYLAKPVDADDVAAALLALGATVRTSRRELPLAELYRLPTEQQRDVVTLAPGELILELELPAVDASVYLKAMDRKRWAFPQVGVAAARVGGETRIALAGVAPIPWLLDGADGLDAATPLPRTAWKVDVARALTRRAVAVLSAE